MHQHKNGQTCAQASLKCVLVRLAWLSYPRSTGLWYGRSNPAQNAKRPTTNINESFEAFNMILVLLQASVMLVTSYVESWFTEVEERMYNASFLWWVNPMNTFWKVRASRSRPSPMSMFFCFKGSSEWLYSPFPYSLRFWDNWKL